MAGLFGLKDVLDPMAQEVRDGYGVIREHLTTLVEEQRETNRLLAVLVEQRGELITAVATKPATLPISKSPSRARAGVKA